MAFSAAAAARLLDTCEPPSSFHRDLRFVLSPERLRLFPLNFPFFAGIAGMGNWVCRTVGWGGKIVAGAAAVSTSDMIVSLWVVEIVTSSMFELTLALVLARDLNSMKDVSGEL